LRKALPILMVFVAAALLLLLRLGAPPLDEAEARSAIVSRHMLQTGQWLWPVPPKPFAPERSPLVYWQAVPFAWAAGGMTEVASRLPSVLWALALLLLTWSLALRWFDGRTALIAAGALASSYGFIHWGRRATSEMAEAALVLACVWFLAKHQGDGRRRWPYLFGLLAGLAASFGELEALGVLAIACIALTRSGQPRGGFPPWQAWLGPVLLAVAVLLATPVAASIASSSWAPLRQLWHGHVARYWQPPGHAYPAYRDLLWLLAYCAPWSVLIPIALVHDLRRHRRNDSRIGQVMLLAGAIALWLLLPSSREPRNLLPVVPLASIITGHLLVQFGRGGSKGVAVVITGLVLAGLFVLGVLPLVGPRPLVREAAARIRELGRPAAFIGEPSAAAAFYLGSPYELLVDNAAAEQWASQTGGLVIPRTGRELTGECWQRAAELYPFYAVVWNPAGRTPSVSATGDPAWLAKHPLRGLKSETLTYVFSAEALARFELGTATLKLSRSADGRHLDIVAESRGGVPGYPMASTIFSRLRDSDYSQVEARDLRTKPSYKHRRFTWVPEGVDYHRHDHCKGPACRDPLHMVTRRDGTKVHCRDKRCGNPDHHVWQLKQAFREPGARDAYHIIAACYVARGFDPAPGAPPQLIRVVNNQALWEVALRPAGEKTIEVPAGKFDCIRVGYDARPLNAAAKESAEEFEGPFGLTGHADLYVDKATRLIVLLDGQIELGLTFKVQMMLTGREAEAAAPTP